MLESVKVAGSQTLHSKMHGINWFWLSSFSQQDLQIDLDLGELDLTSQDEFILDEVDGKGTEAAIIYQLIMRIIEIQ